jgi:hypothetical protein
VTLTANTGTLGDTNITVSLSVSVLQRYSRASAVTSLNFAYDSNATLPSQAIRITNTGNQTLNITSIVGAKFTYTSVPTTIAPGAFATFTATYIATGVAGSKSGTITINSDSDLGAVVINCSMTEILHAIVKYTTAGTSAFTVPYGITSLTYTLKGGGGGGGGAADNEEPVQLGGGGGEGGTSTGSMTVTPGQSVSYTVGAGGGGGGVPGTGGTGVTSTMNSTNAPGGVGGASSGVGGAGGVGNTATGTKGTNGVYWTASSSASQGGAGGGTGNGVGGAGGGYNEGAEQGLAGTAGTAGYVEIRY